MFDQTKEIYSVEMLLYGVEPTDSQHNTNTRISLDRQRDHSSKVQCCPGDHKPVLPSTDMGTQMPPAPIISIDLQSSVMAVIDDTTTSKACKSVMSDLLFTKESAIQISDQGALSQDHSLSDCSISSLRLNHPSTESDVILMVPAITLAERRYRGVSNAADSARCNISKQDSTGGLETYRKPNGRLT